MSGASEGGFSPSLSSRLGTGSEPDPREFKRPDLSLEKNWIRIICFFIFLSLNIVEKKKEIFLDLCDFTI